MTGSSRHRKIKLAFETTSLRIPLADIEMLRAMTPAIKKSVKYAQIEASIREVFEFVEDDCNLTITRDGAAPAAAAPLDDGWAELRYTIVRCVADGVSRRRLVRGRRRRGVGLCNARPRAGRCRRGRDRGGGARRPDGAVRCT